MAKLAFVALAATLYSAAALVPASSVVARTRRPRDTRRWNDEDFGAPEAGGGAGVDALDGARAEATTPRRAPRPAQRAARAEDPRDARRKDFRDVLSPGDDAK